MGKKTGEKKIRCSGFVRLLCYNSSMTGKTRDYLADLANRKGVKLDGEQERDQAWASRKIDELNQLPDVSFSEITEKQRAGIDKGLAKVLKGMEQWTFGV